MRAPTGFPARGSPRPRAPQDQGRVRRARAVGVQPGRRAEIERNTKFLASVGLLVPPKEALEDDEHPEWYMPARRTRTPRSLSPAIPLNPRVRSPHSNK